MLTPDPTTPDRKTQRQREEEKRRRKNPDPQPGQPGNPEIDPSKEDDDETEEEWNRTPR